MLSLYLPRLQECWLQTYLLHLALEQIRWALFWQRPVVKVSAYLYVSRPGSRVNVLMLGLDESPTMFPQHLLTSEYSVALSPSRSFFVFPSPFFHSRYRCTSLASLHAESRETANRPASQRAVGRAARNRCCARPLEAHGHLPCQPREARRGRRPEAHEDQIHRRACGPPEEGMGLRPPA